METLSQSEFMAEAQRRLKGHKRAMKFPLGGDREMEEAVSIAETIGWLRAEGLARPQLTKKIEKIIRELVEL